jgi:GABA(A) receptor-associated protein
MTHNHNTKQFVSSTKTPLPLRSDYKADHTFHNRQAESLRMLNKYPDRVPVICQRNPRADKECPYIDKNKYLIPMDLTLGQFIYVIRKRMQLPSEKALFIFVDGNILSNSSMISQVYQEYQDEDGFLYISYNTENTFGSHLRENWGLDRLID